MEIRFSRRHLTAHFQALTGRLACMAPPPKPPIKPSVERPSAETQKIIANSQTEIIHKRYREGVKIIEDALLPAVDAIRLDLDSRILAIRLARLYFEHRELFDPSRQPQLEVILTFADMAVDELIGREAAGTITIFEKGQWPGKTAQQIKAEIASLQRTLASAPTAEQLKRAEFSTQLREAVRLIEAGNLSDGHQQLIKAQKLYPEDSQLKKQLSRLFGLAKAKGLELEAAGKLAEAGAAFLLALEIRPGEQEIITAIARIREKLAAARTAAAALVAPPPPSPYPSPFAQPAPTARPAPASRPVEMFRPTVPYRPSPTSFAPPRPASSPAEPPRPAPIPTPRPTPPPPSPSPAPPPAKPVDPRVASFLASGKGLLESRRHAESIRSYRAALGVDFDCAAAKEGVVASFRGWLEEVAREIARGNHKGAGTILGKLKEANPPADAELSERISRLETALALRAPAPAAARPAAPSAEQLKRRKFSAHLSEATQAIDAGNLNDAHRKLLEAQRLYPYDTTLKKQLSRLFGAAKAKGQALEVAGKLAEAGAAFGLALELRPGNQDLIDAIRRIRKQLADAQAPVAPPTPPAPPTSPVPAAIETAPTPAGETPAQLQARKAGLLSAAQRLFDIGRYAEAAPYFAELVKIEPNNVVYHCYFVLADLRGQFPVVVNEPHHMHVKAVERPALRAARRARERLAVIELFISRPDISATDIVANFPHFRTLLLSNPKSQVFFGVREAKIAAGLEKDPEVLKAIIGRIKAEHNEVIRAAEPATGPTPGKQPDLPPAPANKPSSPPPSLTHEQQEVVDFLLANPGITTGEIMRHHRRIHHLVYAKRTFPGIKEARAAAEAVRAQHRDHQKE